MYTGASLEGAMKLNNNDCDIAINWSGKYYLVVNNLFTPTFLLTIYNRLLISLYSTEFFNEFTYILIQLNPFSEHFYKLLC